MCEFCYQYPCNVSCPYSDEEAVTSCSICGTGITSGETYYTVDGIEICEECIDDYIRRCCDDEELEGEISCDICNGKITDSNRYLLDGYTVCKGCIDEYVNDCSQQEF